DAEGAPRVARPGGRPPGGRDLPARGPRGGSGKGASGSAGPGRRAVEGPVRVPVGGPVQPLAGSGEGARVPRRDAPRRGREGGALLLDVRPALLLDAAHPGGPGGGRGAGAEGEGGGVPAGRRGDLPLTGERRGGSKACYRCPCAMRAATSTVSSARSSASSASRASCSTSPDSRALAAAMSSLIRRRFFTPMSRKARTTSGSNCEPAQRSISSTAFSKVVPLRYGRSEVIASRVSATAKMRAPMWISSPRRQRG